MRWESVRKIIGHLGAVVLFSFAAVQPARTGELTLFTWEDYISEEVLEDFHKKTGIVVNQIHFDSDKVRNEIVVSANKNKFDIVLFDSISAQIFGKNNILLALSKTQIPNLVNVDTQWSESCGNFGVPYFYGTVGIVYDKTKFREPPDSWADLLQPSAMHHKHVVMIEDMVDMLIPPLTYLGYNMNSERDNELKEAYALLQKQVPAVLNYKYVLTNIATAEGKEMHMALAYSGDQYVLNEATGTDNWRYVVPREGTAIWVDCMSVTSASINKPEALTFLNYLMDVQVAAKNTEYVYGATPISSIRSYLSEEAATDSNIFPSKEQLKSGQMYRILSSDNLNLRRRMLDTLIKRHEAQ